MPGFQVANRPFLPLSDRGRGILNGKPTSRGKIIVPAFDGRTTVTRSGNLGNRTGGRFAWRIEVSAGRLPGNRSASSNGFVDDP